MATSFTAVDDSVTNEIYEGATYSRHYQWIENGAPVDITGATGVSKISRSSGALVFTPTVAITDAVNGKFSITVSAAATGAATPVIAASGTTICRKIDFEDQDKYEPLYMFVNLTLGGNTHQVVRGVARFYPSYNV